ncbi:hypothetical protein AT1G23985 [Arabidopsis thaliana]|uniref:Uncharacterized protein n=1 Tax=Arabidopsis thaliana TaxID=3702 RepID=A0A1P8AUG0_ARATH|nr:uncharacterized protein AT1G23985 [Arabidopsis thaliana]ANM60292.1 hypothetical protein AT1G23985 [Arabidopsis thaliana]|eukprot:NP_001322590.1 hypothetical protein AT1G23985 [Arabidopsis thaliana]
MEMKELLKLSLMKKITDKRTMMKRMMGLIRLLPPEEEEEEESGDWRRSRRRRDLIQVVISIGLDLTRRIKEDEE